MEFADIISKLVDKSARINILQGKITAVSSGSVSLQLRGDTTTLTGIKYLDSYVPAVNDIVFILVNKNDLVVLGKLAPNTTLPAFWAYSTQGTHTTNAGNVLDFAGTNLNRGSRWDTTNYRFTANLAGIYTFQFQVYEQNSTNAKSIAWRKNGTQLTVGDTAIAFQGGTNLADSTINGQITLELAVNDYVDIAVRTGAPNLQWYGGHSWITGHFVMA